MSSLLELTLKSTTILVARFIASPHSSNLKKVAKMRRFVRKMLPASLITSILRGLIPGQVFSSDFLWIIFGLYSDYQISRECYFLF